MSFNRKQKEKNRKKERQEKPIKLHQKGRNKEREKDWLKKVA